MGTGFRRLVHRVILEIVKAVKVRIPALQMMRIAIAKLRSRYGTMVGYDKIDCCWGDESVGDGI